MFGQPESSRESADTMSNCDDNLAPIKELSTVAWDMVFI